MASAMPMPPFDDEAGNLWEHTRLGGVSGIYMYIHILIKWGAKELLRVSESHDRIRMGFTHVMGKDMFMFYFLRHCILPCLEFEIDGYFQSGGQILGYQQHPRKMCWSFPGPGCLPEGSTVSSFMFSFFWEGVTGQALYALHPGKMPGANWSHDALPSLPAKLQARVDGISWEFPTMGDPKVIQVETSPLRDPRHMLYAVYLYIYILYWNTPISSNTDVIKRIDFHRSDMTDRRERERHL